MAGENLHMQSLPSGGRQAVAKKPVRNMMPSTLIIILGTCLLQLEQIKDVIDDLLAHKSSFQCMQSNNSP